MLTLADENAAVKALRRWFQSQEIGDVDSCAVMAHLMAWVATNSPHLDSNAPAPERFINLHIELMWLYLDCFVKQEGA